MLLHPCSTSLEMQEGEDLPEPQPLKKLILKRRLGGFLRGTAPRTTTTTTTTEQPETTEEPKIQREERASLFGLMMPLPENINMEKIVALSRQLRRQKSLTEEQIYCLAA